MRLHIFIWIILAGSLFSCEKENVTPSKVRNPFAPAPEATDATSELKREFYEKTGCFLLFNDTLRHEYMGVDAFGNPYYDTELLAMDWDLGTVKRDYILRYEYLDGMAQQQKAYDFLVNNLKSSLNKLPYSILAVNKIELRKEDWMTGQVTWESKVCEINSRCMAVAIEGLFAEDVKPEVYVQDLCCTIIFPRLFVNEEDDWWGSKAYGFVEYDMGYGYYNKMDLYVETLEDLHREGFLVDVDEVNFPDVRQDASAYIKAVLLETEEEFREKYGQYWKIMEKYEIIKPLVEKEAEDLGIKFK